MKISFKGDYAIKTLVFLALRHSDSAEENRYCQISEISRSQDIPKKFLEQILLTLKNAGYVNSQRGVNGGYVFAKDPRAVTLGEIIRLMDGTTAPIACVSRSCYQACDYEKRCVLKPVWENVREAENNIVDRVTFYGLAKEQAELDRKSVETFVYNI
ncbi:MAG: Rrf2 family transcriptional regulator [Spirochaetia bacterium]|nr:Rrf2 family transcriptional regulator [Spirochaetia bacterium]